MTGFEIDIAVVVREVTTTVARSGHLRFLEAFAVAYMPVCVCIIQLVWLQKSTSASSYGCIGRGNSHHCFYFLRKRVCGAVGEIHSEFFFFDNNSTIGLGTRLSLTMGLPSSAHWGRVGMAQAYYWFV